MIHAIVVTYNMCCADSSTCQSILRQKSLPFDMIVYDNSDADYGNRGFCSEHSWRYLGGTGNKGLSAAYNAVIDLLYQEKGEGYICLLDDDTTLPEDFFERLQMYADGNPQADILLPILRQNGKIISPCRISRHNRYFTSVQECQMAEPKKMQAFNSCMTVKLATYMDYRYDERIFLDGVDHAFMRDMKRMEKAMLVIPIECEQSFSGGQKGTLNGAVSRFKIYARDSRILYEQEPLQYWGIVGKRALHLCLMYRSFLFLKLLFAK